MSDVFTTTSLDYVVAAYEELAHEALVPELMYDAVASVFPTNRTAPGTSVRLFVRGVLAAATSALNESTDVTAVPLTDTTVDLTLAEYGNAVITTAKLRGASLIEIDPIAAGDIGYNAGLSMDTIARNALAGGSNVRYAAGSGTAATSRNTVVPANTIRATDVRRIRAALRRNNVRPFPGAGGSFYSSFIAPDVLVDLQEETGQGSWVQPREYSDPSDIWTGEAGRFAGVRFIESSRAPVFADAGSSTTDTDVYATLFLGFEALAKVWAMREGNGPTPEIVISPITDHLRRFHPLGWKWFGGYGRFRETALWRLESSSSVASNTVAGTDEPTVDI